MILLGGCASPKSGSSAVPEPGPNQESVLLALDRAFAESSAQAGVVEAFDRFMADDGVLLPTGADPVVGREAIRAHLEMNLGEGTLVWEPLAAHASAAGDLGYTYGVYTFSVPDDLGGNTVQHGKYASVWKRFPDGSWKVVLDTGNASPGPWAP